jgi:HSP20 family protein
MTLDEVGVNQEVITMLAIKKWSPFKELSTLHEEMDEVFRKTFGSMGGLARGFLGEAWYPTIESFVKGGNLVVRCEIPGIDPKDINISIVGNMLTIKGERKASEEIKREDYLLNEVSYGSFERTLSIPEGVKADNVHASYKNGILEVTMPAEKAALPRKITVEVEGGKEEKAKKVA